MKKIKITLSILSIIAGWFLVLGELEFSDYANDFVAYAIKFIIGFILLYLGNDGIGMINVLKKNAKHGSNKME